MITIEKSEAAALPDTPSGTVRLDYTSNIDGMADYAFAIPPQTGGLWIVCLHGHGSNGDQIFSRQDVRECWLPRFLDLGAGVLAPNLRDNAWMSPAAASDLHALLEHVRNTYGAKRFVFYSGSMGGTSNLIYSALQPHDVTATVSLGAASDLSNFHKWCRERNEGIIKEIADAIEAAYGKPVESAEVYKRHSALQNAANLTMPIFLAHGGSDELIPASQSRELAAKLHGQANFTYHEIDGGNHDSPLFIDEAWAWLKEQIDSHDWQ